MKKHITLSALVALTGLIFMQPAFAAESPSNKSNVSATSQAQSSLLDLNSATLEQLSALKGIGKTKAKAIVEYRQSVGKFHHVDQLSEVRGIGEKLLAALKPQLRV
ncbi:ComEA family DNA-binding protein [Alteromonas facilis]|uniref:ComEA family DNA-binding protein n=1 Tax=Alteromonas facilis TaxID=2048004 RepID=UPI000C281427|nr:helix-hairpin-helix domain-containing protein [Alteromonas facilis]